jgi:hypothetical protein
MPLFSQFFLIISSLTFKKIESIRLIDVYGKSGDYVQVVRIAELVESKRLRA